MTGQWPEGCGIACGDEVLYAAPRQNQTTAPAARGNAPLLVLRTTSPGGGSLLFAQLLLSQAVQSIVSLKSPPPGETSPQATEGVHFQRAKPGCEGFRCHRQRFAAGGIYNPPSEPARSVGGHGGTQGVSPDGDETFELTCFGEHCPADSGQPPLSHKKCGVLISKNAAFCKTLYFTISIPAAVSSSFFVDFFIILYTPTVRRGTR